MANQLVAQYAEPEKLIDYVDCGEIFNLAGSNVGPGLRDMNLKNLDLPCRFPLCKRGSNLLELSHPCI